MGPRGAVSPWNATSLPQDELSLDFSNVQSHARLGKKHGSKQICDTREFVTKLSKFPWALTNNGPEQYKLHQISCYFEVPIMTEPFLVYRRHFTKNGQFYMHVSGSRQFLSSLV